MHPLTVSERKLSIKMCPTIFTLHAAVLFQFTLNTASQFLPSGQFPFPQPGGPSMMQMPAGPPFPPLPPPMIHAPVSLQMQQRLPVVVMPYYSKSADRPALNHVKKKKRKPKRILFDDSSSTDTSDTSSSSSSDFDFRTKKQGSKKKRHQVLTPVVSYVTKDGYVVYQKKIKRDKAKDWLELGNRKSNFMEDSLEPKESGELNDMPKRFRHRKGKRSVYRDG